jgi:HlyD family secretion protein
MRSASRLSRLFTLLAIAAAAGLAGWQVRSYLQTPATTGASVVLAVGAADQHAAPRAVTALGRLEPKDGVIRLAGPSQSSVVIARLLVDKGDHVDAGQVVAILDNFEAAKADLARVDAELNHARSEFERLDKLYRTKIVAVSERDNWRVKVDVLEAERQHAEVELAQAAVRAPISGQVLDVHARAGEKVGPDGILELAKTDQMYAIAEVYETDIGWVRAGQRATITSRALAQPVQGTVERVGMKVGKADVLGVDPIAKTDARVVEVEIRLDDNQRVGGLTNAQVEVAITP